MVSHGSGMDDRHAAEIHGCVLGVRLGIGQVIEYPGGGWRESELSEDVNGKKNFKLDIDFCLWVWD
jgi:hypothetical protein